METQVKEQVKIKNIKSDEIIGLDLIKFVESKASVK
jgi:hypothetical protein